MKLWSTGWANGEPIPDRYAAATLGPDGLASGLNLSPPLLWSDLPEGTRSLVLVCHDFDMPGQRHAVDQPGADLPVDLPRVDFFHWLLLDLPPTLVGLAEGAFSRGFSDTGKPGPQAPHGARLGLNDFSTGLSAEAQWAGPHHGYDGPWPPLNDSLVHHYLFTLYAVSVDRLPVADPATGPQVREALAGLVLDAATLSGTYTLNRRLRQA